MSYRTEQDADTPLARWRFEEAAGSTSFAPDVGGVTLTANPSNQVTAGELTPVTRPAYRRGIRFSSARVTGTGVAAWRPQTVEVLAQFDSLPSTGSSLRTVLYRTDGSPSTQPLPLILTWDIDGSVGNRGRLGFGWWTGTAWVSISAPSGAVTAGANLVWHIVGVYDGATTLTIYVNGTSVATGTVAARGTMTGAGGTVNIGARNDNTSSVDGRIFDVALYNGALSAGRVAAHYNASIENGFALSTAESFSGIHFEGAEATNEANGPGPTISGGGNITFRASALEPTQPALAKFTPHPGDGGATSTPWFIREGFGDGTTFPNNAHSTWIYTPGGAIERVIGSVRCTRTDTDFTSLASACEPGISNPAEWGPSWAGTWKPDQQDWDIHASVGAWPATIRWSQNLYIAWQRTGATVTTAGDIGLYWSNIVVMHKRYTYAGQPTQPLPAITVRELVHDLMGRGFNVRVEFDPERVEQGTPWLTRVEHAAWWNGVSAREVLSYATTFAPGMWWAVMEPGVTGLPKFLVGRWDGPVRYVFRTSDVELSGGANDLANRCLVRYVGTTYGNTKTVWVAEVRANVRGLADAGIVRTMVIDVTNEGMIAPDVARERGLSALRQAAQESTAGRVTVRGPIYDMVQGRMVEPWEIVGGSPVIVADGPVAYSRSTSLSGSVSADGAAVFRLKGVAFDASSNSATLSLDGGSRSLIGRFRTEATARRYEVGNARL